MSLGVITKLTQEADMALAVLAEATRKNNDIRDTSLKSIKTSHDAAVTEYLLQNETTAEEGEVLDYAIGDFSETVCFPHVPNVVVFRGTFTCTWRTTSDHDSIVHDARFSAFDIEKLALTRLGDISEEQAMRAYEVALGCEEVLRETWFDMDCTLDDAMTRYSTSEVLLDSSTTTYVTVLVPFMVQIGLEPATRKADYGVSMARTCIDIDDEELTTYETMVFQYPKGHGCVDNKTARD
jgi:hypothetical protein